MASTLSSRHIKGPWKMAGRQAPSDRVPWGYWGQSVDTSPYGCGWKRGKETTEQAKHFPS